MRRLSGLYSHRELKQCLALIEIGTQIFADSHRFYQSAIIRVQYLFGCVGSRIQPKIRWERHFAPKGVGEKAAFAAHSGDSVQS